MAETIKINDIFFKNKNFNHDRVLNIVDTSLSKSEDGELFLEYTQSESLVFDDNTLKSSSFNTDQGFGLRSIVGETTGFGHSSEISEDALIKATKTVNAIKDGKNNKVKLDAPPIKTNHHFYSEVNPLNEIDYNCKVDILQKINSYLRKKNNFVKQVSISLAGNWQVVKIIKANGFEVGDIRPLVRLNISVVVEKDGRMESGSCGVGGRVSYSKFINEKKWKESADQALRQALVNLKSISAPAGQMQVVLGNGWPGILLHEAIGHGLEGDFNRKKTSAFSGLMGKQVASKGVTVVDDGTIMDRRGSITIDDEGTPAQKTFLIEDGILTGYIQDRMNARLMGMKPTGNGRRESYAYQPMPRMTNTYMQPGEEEPEEIIASVDEGLYAVNFDGGQVDITNGKFVFSASEAYLIKNGKIAEPVKGATLIGNGPDILTKVKMIGNDMKLDPGIGTCGKAGQGVPVGVGQPTILIEGLTVGGTSHK